VFSKVGSVSNKFLLLCFPVGLLLFVLSACQKVEISNTAVNTNSRINQAVTLPTPLSWSVAEEGLKETINNSLTRKCYKDVDVAFYSQGQYLYMVRRVQRIAITPDPTRPTPTDLEKGILWVGYSGIIADSYKVIDFSNRRIVDAGEGTGLPSTKIFAVYKKPLADKAGWWECDLCKGYEAPTCPEVDRILSSINEAVIPE
jgi:hypothetical protein